MFPLWVIDGDKAARAMAKGLQRTHVIRCQQGGYSCTGTGNYDQAQQLSYRLHSPSMSTLEVADGRGR